MELKELYISGYRGIKDVDVSLGKINLIIGPNNTGKSAILEAAGILLSKDSHFTDAKGANLFEYLINEKKYDPQFFINVDYEKAVIKSGDSEINILYQGKGLPQDPNLSSQILELLKENIEQKILNEYPIGYNLAVEKVLINFAKELGIEDTGKIQSAMSRISKKYKIIFNKIFEQSIQQFLEIPKIIFYASDVIYVYLPTRLQIAIDVGLGKFYGNINHLKCQAPPKNSSNIVLGLQRRSPLESIYKLYDKLVKQGKIDKALKAIKHSIPYIFDIRKTDPGKIYIISSLSSKPIPLTSMGDGFKSLLEIAFLSAFIDRGVVLLEEPELYLHPGFAQITSKIILHNSEYKQFIITTHSIDFITDILSVANDMGRLHYINVIRVHRREDIPDLVIEILTGEQALDEIESIGVDLRVT